MLNTGKIKHLREAQHQTKANIARAMHMSLAEYKLLENAPDCSVKLTQVIQLADLLQTTPLAILAIPAEAGPTIQAELMLIQIEKKRWKQKMIRDIQ